MRVERRRCTPPKNTTALPLNPQAPYRRTRAPVRDVEVAAVEARLLVLQHALDQLILAGGQQPHVVALLAQLLEHAEDGAKHVEVGGGAHVALVGGEREDRDRQLLLSVGLLAQARPVDGAHAQGGDAVGQRVALAGVGVAAGKHDGLQRAVQLRERHLQRHLHGVHAQLAAQPLLGGLEHQGQRHQVGDVELLEGLDGLGGVLASGTAHEGKAWGWVGGVGEGRAVGG